MKVGQIGPTFIFPGKTVTFLLVESLVTSSILKMRKSHKKLAPSYAYPLAYTQIRDRGGTLCPPPALNRVNSNPSLTSRYECGKGQYTFYPIKLSRFLEEKKSLSEIPKFHKGGLELESLKV